MLELRSNLSVERGATPLLWIITDHPDVDPHTLLDTVIRLNGTLVHVVAVESLADEFGLSVEPAPDTIRVRCLECGWQGIGAELLAQACPQCDGRVAEEGSTEYNGAKRL
jgi:hypothetical protein